MVPSIYPVPIAGAGRLYVMPKPSGEWLAEDLAHYRSLGVQTIVSLLTLEEMRELGLTRQAELCRRQAMGFRHYPIPDRGVPDAAAFADLTRAVFAELTAGTTVAVHCRAGIGRSGMLAAGLAMLAGNDCEAAVALVSAARRLTVPDTEEQAQFLKRLAIQQLSCGLGASAGA